MSENDVALRTRTAMIFLSTRTFKELATLRRGMREAVVEGELREVAADLAVELIDELRRLREYTHDPSREL